MLSDVVPDLGLCWNRIMGALCSKASGEGITCWRRQSSTSWDINSANAGLKHYKFPWMQCGIVRVREFVYSFCLVIIFAALAIPHLEGLTWGLCEQWWKKVSFCAPLGSRWKSLQLNETSKTASKVTETPAVTTEKLSASLQDRCHWSNRVDSDGEQCQSVEMDMRHVL